MKYNCIRERRPRFLQRKFFCVFTLIMTMLVIFSACQSKDQKKQDAPLHEFDYTTVYEAENYTDHSQCTLSDTYYPFIGEGCIQFDSTAGWAEWNNINAKSKGDYSLIIQYSNNNEENVLSGLTVNGVAIKELTFVPTKAVLFTRDEVWENNWKVASVVVPLNAGANTVRLAVNHSNGGALYIDNLAVSDGHLSALTEPIFDVKDYGAKGDGLTSDTQAIQAAVEACAGTGGSVYLHDGKFLSGTIQLKSDMTFYLDASATLIGTLDKTEYPSIIPATGAYIQEFRPGLKQMIYAESEKNITVTGGGTMDGQGNHPTWKGPEYERPMVLCFVSSQNIRVTNIDIKDSACWTFVPLDCDDMIIDGINIDTTNHINRDGIDVVDCHNVSITNSALLAGDDAICPKSGFAKGVDRLHVKNVSISSCGANGIKYGTSSYGDFTNSTFEDITMTHINLAGISLGISDGANVDNIQFKNIHMNNLRVPISILNAAGIRGRRGIGDPEKEGIVKNISFKDISARNILNDYGSHIDGVIKNGVTHWVEDIHMENLDFVYPGGFKNAIPKDPKEYAGEYPDYYWCDPKMPAYGMYIRHAKNITLKNCTFTTLKSDVRPAIAYTDVETISDDTKPHILGVEDGMKYRHKPGVTIIYEALCTATLNGELLANETNVSASGKYQLKVTGEKGNTNEINFEIFIPLVDEVFVADKVVKGATIVNINTPSSKKHTLWFAPADSTVFKEGTQMTKVDGTATSILAPKAEGVYKLFILDDQCNISEPSFATLEVDDTPPIVTGVKDGITYRYQPGVKITFASNCTAKLNGATFKSGDSVDTAGDHQLVVTEEAGNQTKLQFKLYIPYIDTLFTKAQEVKGGKEVEVTSTGDATNTFWLAPEGSTLFSEGDIMTKAVGTSTTMIAPSKEGKYKLYIVDATGKISEPSYITLLVDNTPPQVTGMTEDKQYAFKVGVKIVYESKCTATLNGTSYESGTPIQQSGLYTLIVTDQAGNIRTLHFKVLTSS